MRLWPKLAKSNKGEKAKQRVKVTVKITSRGRRIILLCIYHSCCIYGCVALEDIFLASNLLCFSNVVETLRHVVLRCDAMYDIFKAFPSFLDFSSSPRTMLTFATKL